MIVTFKDSDTEALFNGVIAPRFASFANVGKRKLRMVDAAARIEDLRVPPGNRLEALSGDRAGQWSIRVNDQFHVCFEWADGQAFNVEIVDYHCGQGDNDMKNTKILAPTHPGEVLLEEFLKPLGISQYRLAKSLLVPLRRVNEIVLRRRGISADMALRLGRFFGTTAEFWLNLQSGYEKEVALRDGASQTLQQIIPLKDTQRISAA